MSNPLYLQEKYQTTNAPITHKLVQDSFVFVPTAGARCAPEELLLEFMREVFFKNPYKKGKKAETIAENVLKLEEKYSLGDDALTRELAVLHALRGRRKKAKKSRSSGEEKFFAPAYPYLAKYGWRRKESERAIAKFLLEGPIAQYFWNNGENEEAKHDRDKNLEIIRRALMGNNSCTTENLKGKDILSVTLGPEKFVICNSLDNEKIAKENLEFKTRYRPVIHVIRDDELAKRITKDLITLCKLESKIPRIQWLHLFMTYLRFALPIWLLAQMKIIVLVHQWILEAMDDGFIKDKECIQSELQRRNQGLLHPTITPTRELFEHIEQYIHCKVELDILLYNLQEIETIPITEKIRLSLDDDNGKNKLSIVKLLEEARDSTPAIKVMDRFKEVAEGMSVATFLSREAALFKAWKDPLKQGQGNNIDEFFRVLHRPEMGDDGGGYLLTPFMVKRKIDGFRVFPGQLLLKLITFLAAQDKHSNQRTGGGGMLVLQDVEDHFAQYGIDFSASAGARPELINDL